jgi:hypothetical protein
MLMAGPNRRATRFPDRDHFAFWNGTDVGNDNATPVSDDYTSADSTFRGRIKRVQIDIDAAAQYADHVITTEEQYRVAIPHRVAPRADRFRRQPLGPVN